MSVERSPDLSSTVSLSEPRALAPISIRELLAGEVKLASPPELFVKLSSLLDDPYYDQEEVALLIEGDPGLTARLLKIVNSAYFGFPGEIASLRKAINVIGTRELRDLVLGTLIVDRFSTLPGGLMPMRDFWAMSVRCALIARALAARHPGGHLLQSVFLCGLLHEIGRLVLYHRVPELARGAILLARREKIPQRTAQQKLMGLDHYRVGAALTRHWRLPEAIAVTIEHHTQPAQAAAFSQECLLVAIANRLSRSEAADLDEPAIELSPEQWQTLRLNDVAIEEAASEAELGFQTIFKQIFRTG